MEDHDSQQKEAFQTPARPEGLHRDFSWVGEIDSVTQPGCAKLDV